MATLLLLIAVTGYALASAGFLVYLVTRREATARAALPLAAMSALIHFASYGLDCSATRAMVVTSPHGMLSLLALLIVIVQLAVASRHGLPILGAFVLPLGTMAAAAAAFASMAVTPQPKLTGPLFPLHVITTYLGFAGFAAAFGVALAYLVQERQLRSRHPTSLAFVLPPLGRLDGLTGRLLAWSTGALGAGIATGLLFSRQAAETWWTGDPKVEATLFAGVLYATALALRAAGWRGRRTAWLAIAGFVAVLITFALLPHAPLPPAP